MKEEEVDETVISSFPSSLTPTSLCDVTILTSLQKCIQEDKLAAVAYDVKCDGDYLDTTVDKTIKTACLIDEDVAGDETISFSLFESLLSTTYYIWYTTSSFH